MPSKKPEIIDAEEVEQPTFAVTLIIHTNDKDTQKVHYERITEEKLDELINTVISAYETVKKNSSLTLVTPDGTIYIFNVDNITCVEIRR